MDTTQKTKNTAAFYAQAAITFGLAFITLVVGILFLPVDPWMRAFLGMGTVFLVSTSFTLAKCVRDQQERTEVYHRLDQARVDRILAEHDPYNPPYFEAQPGHPQSHVPAA